MAVRPARYPMAEGLAIAAKIIGIKPHQILRRAGLPDDLMDPEGRGATAEQLIAAWAAFEAEAKRPDLAYHMAMTLARAPFTPSMLAFSCSRDIETGIARLAVFKPLIGPMRLVSRSVPDGFEISMTMAEPGMRAPPWMQAFELVFLVECCRNFTAEPVTPLAVALPDPAALDQTAAAYLGVHPVRGPVPRLVLSPDDARRPLITENSALWTETERHLRQKLTARAKAEPMQVRVRGALMDMLPAGETTMDALCARLHVSKRSVQRHLQAEGESFQSLLAVIRAELAVSYLTKERLSVEETSYLLGYREPSSFFRAFQSWTGSTPAAIRDAHEREATGP